MGAKWQGLAAGSGSQGNGAAQKTTGLWRDPVQEPCTAVASGRVSGCWDESTTQPDLQGRAWGVQSAGDGIVLAHGAGCPPGSRGTEMDFLAATSFLGSSAG